MLVINMSNGEKTIINQNHIVRIDLTDKLIEVLLTNGDWMTIMSEENPELVNYIKGITG